MRALVVSLALVDVADEAEAYQLAARVDDRARADVHAILSEHELDDASALGLVGFGTTVLMLDVAD